PAVQEQAAREGRAREREITNKRSEAFYGTSLRPRFNALRNVRRCTFVKALLDLPNALYLFARPHLSFGGRPPILRGEMV
ncbi:MAG: hypothetical protein L0Z54_02730, partial [Thermoplasmata archaeon]|nr:hypothetical protein [Thermoplasmata archaeon]